MRFTYNVLRYVNIGWLRALRAVRAVNVFKKKSCGASLCKSEEKIGSLVKVNGTDYLYVGNSIFDDNIPVYQNVRNYLKGHKPLFPIKS